MGVSTSRTTVVVHTQSGDAAVFQVEDQDPSAVRSAVTPLLQSAAVRFWDETLGEPQAAATPGFGYHVLVVTVVVVAVVVIVGVLGVTGVFGSRGAVEDKTAAGATANPSASPSIAHDKPWPKRLAGNWMGSNGARMVIGESADGAIITLVTTDGTVLNWKFSGETFVGDTPSPGHVPFGPFGRTQASTSPYTGTYVWSASNFYGSPMVTAQVTFQDTTLTINITNSRGMPGLTRFERYSLSSDGNQLIVSAGAGAGTSFTRQ